MQQICPKLCVLKLPFYFAQNFMTQEFGRTGGHFSLGLSHVVDLVVAVATVI